MSREAEVLARRLTWLSTLAFDYARGATMMETGTIERVLSELVRFEIAASDHARAIAPERSRHEAVNERSKLTRFQRLNLPHLLWRKAPRRAALK